jgi:hypothetical protein
MLKKVRNLRALRPRQWARVRVPDRAPWNEPGEWTGKLAGREVDVCLTPILDPRDGYPAYFEWRYRIAYRHPGSKSSGYHRPDGGWITPYDLDMDPGHIKPFYHDDAEYRRFLDGDGAWLYQPASDDPVLCPGPDCSIYLCEICGEHVMPWSDNDGNLVCRDCEVTGLVIDPGQVERLEQVREFASQIGRREQLEHQLSHWLGSGTFFGRRSQCVLRGDFAPHSFSFCHYILPEGPGQTRQFAMNGGLVYSGPGSPGDGSFPALSVNLHDGVGWFCHT